MAIDTSARPHELLNLKIKDIHFEISSNEMQYAEVLLPRKTKTRTLHKINKFFVKRQQIHLSNSFNI